VRRALLVPVLLAALCTAFLALRGAFAAQDPGAAPAPQGDTHAAGAAPHASQTPEQYFAGMVDHTQDHYFQSHDRAVPDTDKGEAFVPLTRLTNHRFMMVVSGGVVFVIFCWLAFRRRGGAVVPRGKIENLIDTFVIYIRDEIVRPNIDHHHADHVLPYFVLAFFFVLACNLLGMIPAPSGGTATGNIAVTGALALTTFAVGTFGGMIAQGPVAYWKHLLPHGLPGWLTPIIFLIEVIGLGTKHFALAVRLFANMIAGHILLAVLLSFIMMAGAQSAGLGYGVAVPVVLGSVAINLLELFVAFLQAFIFTFLTTLFIGTSVVFHHDDHHDHAHEAAAH